MSSLIMPAWRLHASAVNGVVDGDTIHATVDLDYDVYLNVTYRLAGIDCPEHTTAEGAAATAFVSRWYLDHGQNVVVESWKDRKGKYGRYLAVIYASADDHELGVETSLNALLLSSGHATLYMNGRWPGLSDAGATLAGAIAAHVMGRGNE